MSDLIYHLFVIVVLVVGIFKGFRQGFTRQVPSCIGLAVGALCSYVFRFPAEEWLEASMPAISQGPCGPFVISTLACSAIFLIAYTAFYIVTYPLSLIFRNIETGMLDAISGALFGLLNYGVMLSLFCNIFVCLFPDCRLMEYARHDDGDIVHEIMLLSPWILGSVSVDDLSHTLQLEHAKSIS